MSLNVAISVLTFFLTVLLSFVVLLEDYKRKVNRIFSLLSLVISFWVLNNFLADLAHNLDTALLLTRLAIIWPPFLPILFNALITELYYADNKRHKREEKFLFIGSIIVTGVIVFLSQTDLNIINISIGPLGVDYLPGLLYYLLFFYLAVAFSFSFTHLFKISRQSADPQKTQAEFMLLGSFLTILLAVLANIVLPLLGYSFFNVFGPPTVLFFVGLTAIAVLQHHLFNIKVIATELLTFALWISILLRTLVSKDPADLLINSGLLVLVVIIGIFLIRSVFREVEQREKIQVLAKDLEETNERQEKLIHFVGHEVKGYLTNGEYAFAEMIDGDFGKLPAETQGLATTALAELRKGVVSVTDILQAANLKRGTVSYDMKPVNFMSVVEEEAAKFEPAAKQKGLTFTLDIDRTAPYTVNMDRKQFEEHVIRNLIDNSVKYTEHGTITVSLRRTSTTNANSTTPTTPLQTQVFKDVVLFTVKDSGVGISDEDKKHLFTEGGRGKDSIKVNVHSTGYGLYIAKQIVDAHGGKIWVESDGTGKGSVFYVELPVV